MKFVRRISTNGSSHSTAAVVLILIISSCCHTTTSLAPSSFPVAIRNFGSASVGRSFNGVRNLCDVEWSSRGRNDRISGNRSSSCGLEMVSALGRNFSFRTTKLRQNADQVPFAPSDNKKYSTLPMHRSPWNRVRSKLSSSFFFKNRSVSLSSAKKILVRMVLPMLMLIFGVTNKPMSAFAMAAAGGSKGPVTPMKREEVISAISLWFVLFLGLALLHAAEIAITTLYPWKVREFAEQEEKMNAGSNKRGIFKILNDDITRVLTTILVTSTAASIYATTIFTHVAASLFGTRGENWGAVALTAVTLFFVELLPKSIGVTNAERVARLMVPPINMISTVVSPLGIALSWLSKQVLSMAGLYNEKDSAGVSDSELRLIVMGARDSGTIDHSEQEMIKGVLNLQSQRVKEIMRPRVDIVAVPKQMSVASVLGVIRESGYSRIPVYDGEIDNIVGIVLAKSVLDFFVKGVIVDDKEQSDEQDSPVASYSLRSVNGETTKGYVRALTGSQLAMRMEKSIFDADLIEECYFVPDTANGWSILEEMRKRRIHMAIVVDEYGGTEGLVSLEDIVEEVVGEIYDEDDEEVFELSEDSITLQEDGTFMIRGDADLEDCDTILGLSLDEERELKEFGTLSGFLCMCAGEIPKTGDFILSRGWSFEIIDAEPKKILNVKVERLVGFFDGDETEQENNAVLGFLKKGTKNKEEIVEADVDYMEDIDFIDSVMHDEQHEAQDDLEKTLGTNGEEESTKIERMVENTEKKRTFVKEMIAEMNQGLRESGPALS